MPYDYNAKQAKVLKNSSKKPQASKQKFFKDGTKKLMAQGRSRSAARNLVRQAISSQGENNNSPFSGNRPRAERKQRAKELKVPFTPTYNAPLWATKWETNEETGQLYPTFIKVSGQ